MTDLTQQKCLPCEGGFPPLNRAEAEDLLDKLTGWSLARQGKGITKEYAFKDFKEALVFVNRVGEVAEAEGHHPDVSLSWGKVGISLTTHAIQGLSVNDFIVAAKVDALQK